MDTTLFAANRRVVVEALAAELGCESGAFESNALTVVPLPAKAHERWEALALSLGTGTVLSLPATAMQWVSEHAPRNHVRALQPFFLQDLADEMTRSGGGRATAHGISLGFTLAGLPPAAPLPPGFSFERVVLEWMREQRKSGEFDNALGDAGPGLNETVVAFVVRDRDGTVAAVAGIWDEPHGRMEIGLDVRRDHRSRGLALPVTRAATAWIMEQGRTPIYTCGVTNLRSQRVALSCGYLPLWTVARIWRAPEGRSAYDD